MVTAWGLESSWAKSIIRLTTQQTNSVMPDLIRHPVPIWPAFPPSVAGLLRRTGAGTTTLRKWEIATPGKAGLAMTASDNVEAQMRGFAFSLTRSSGVMGPSLVC